MPLDPDVTSMGVGAEMGAECRNLGGGVTMEYTRLRQNALGVITLAASDGLSCCMYEKPIMVGKNHVYGQKMQISVKMAASQMITVDN